MPARRPVPRRTPPRPHSGAEHRRLRKQIEKTVRAGAAVCARCGTWIRPDEPWDLGHRDAAGAKTWGLYNGPEHRDCSRTAGGWKRQGQTGMRPPARRRAQPTAKALKLSKPGDGEPLLRKLTTREVPSSQSRDTFRRNMIR